VSEALRPESGWRSFPAAFWVANVMELFERAAYYGLNSLLAIYLAGRVSEGGLGFGEDRVGLLQSLVYAATYVVPILGGALADRYGYRRMLLVAFSFLSAGYFLAAEVSGYGVVFFALVVMAIGSGLFKPIISGTIARTTSEKNSGMGFGIYYWMINLGALLAPIVAGLARDGLGWKWVFFLSSMYCGLMFLPTALVYRDPPRPENTKSLGEVLRGAVTVLSDARFMLLVFLYSCFWILYFQNFGSVLWYLRDFVDTSPMDRFFAGLGLDYRFGPEHVTVINAGTIVLLQMVVNLAVRRVKPLPTMVSGILIGAAGFFCLALSTRVEVFMLGIAVFSIGEMTCHPKYYSYIGLVAPADKKAVYMGYAFLYGVIGSLVGSNIGGEAYRAVLKPLVGQPGSAATLSTFWLVFGVLGVAAALLLVGYNRWFGTDTATTRARARRVMKVIYGGLLLLAPALVLLLAWRRGTVPPKTWVQATIMVAMGGGGLWTLLRGSVDDSSPPPGAAAPDN